MTLMLNPKWQRLISQPNLADAVIDGFDHTYLDTGAGLVRVSNVFESNEELVQELIELGFQTGNRIDASKPIADFVIAGNRFHAVLPFGVSAKPLVSIRMHPKTKVRLDHLVEVEMLTEGQKAFLLRALAARKNLLVCGPTSAGKTTLLSALLQEIQERTICIEQIPELQLSPPAISLTERTANQEGLGAVGLQQLVIESLRMRPDRIVVGEVRGEEFGVLLQAMNNGHSGSMTTLHTKDLQSVGKRLLMLGKLSGLDPDLTIQLVLGSIDLVVQLGKVEGKRRLLQLGEFTSNGLEIREVLP